MAIKAKGQISLSTIIDVKATYRYYVLLTSTLAVPSKPTTYPPDSKWSDTEPSYTEGSTDSLYVVDCTVFCDDTFVYSGVSLSTAYEAAKTAYNKAVNAAKVATNYIKSTTNGLIVGNVSASTLGKNILIDADTVDIRNGDIVLASYGEKLIELGKNATDAVISLVNDKGKIEYDSDDGYFQITGDKLRLNGLTEASLYSNYYNGENIGKRSGTYTSSDQVYLYSSQSSNIDPETQVGVWTTSSLTIDSTRIFALADTIYEISRYGSTYETVSGDITLNPQGVLNAKKILYISNNEKTSYKDGVNGWYFGVDGTTHATHSSKGPAIGFHYASSQDTTSLIEETSSGVISINGMEFGVNNILWSGSYIMTASQTATLSEAINKQANGIVLVFSRYSSDTAQNYHFTTHFIPKAQISKHAGCGHLFMMSSDGSFSLFAAKYLYINNNNIVGNDINDDTGTGACGIKYTNGGYVLRYVIGV